MALKSSTFKAGSDSKDVDVQKARLQRRHQGAIEKVVSDAKTLAEDRRKALKEIANTAIRGTASR